MSEPASLYARLTFGADDYPAYLASTPAAPAAFDDWVAWLTHHSMAGGAAAIAGALQNPSPLATTVGAVFDQWRSARWMGADITTQAATGCCRVVLLEATENYGELANLLAPLRGAAAWTQPDADDFILVTDFLWDAEAPPMACLALHAGASRFVDAVPPAWRDEAFAAFEQRLGALAPPEGN